MTALRLQTSINFLEIYTFSIDLSKDSDYTPLISHSFVFFLTAFSDNELCGLGGSLFDFLQLKIFLILLILLNPFAVIKDLKYADSHEWVKVDGNSATVGITDHAQDHLGDVVYVELPEVGANVKQGGCFGAVESVKATSDINSPVSGKVVEVNEELNSSPGLVSPIWPYILFLPHQFIYEIIFRLHFYCHLRDIFNGFLMCSCVLLCK